MMMGRLRPGITEQQANVQLDVLLRQSITAGLKRLPAPQFIPHIQLKRASKGFQILREQFSKPLWLSMITVALVLLIACANLATLLLARSAARKNEIAVRLSMGAPRPRIIRQLLTEALVLSGLGGVLGVLLAFWGTRVLLLLMAGGGEPITLNAHPDLMVLGFTAAASLFAAILCGLAPAFHSTRLDLIPALNATACGAASGNARARLGLGKCLVVSQLALSLLLVAAAALFVRTLHNLEHETLGFNPHNLLLFGIDPTQSGYRNERLTNFYGVLLERFQSLPGILSATMSTAPLISGRQSHVPISIEGYKPEPEQDMGVDWNNIGPAFFQTMGIRILLGRGIEWRDTATSPKVAVVNEAVSRRILGGKNPVGHRFRFQNLGQPGEDYEIIGMVQDAKYATLRRDPRPTVYIPYSQVPLPLGSMHFELHTAGEPLSLVTTVRRVVHDLNPDVPLSDVKTQTEQIAETLVEERLLAWLSSLLGGLGLLIAAVGLYGIIAYSVRRRTAEIGVRMALGAQGGDILSMVLRESAALLLFGIVMGVPAAVVVARVASSQISDLVYGLKVTDPRTVFIAALVLAPVALLAGFLPARKASHVDPMVALRRE
jgi:predicted permease